MTIASDPTPAPGGEPSGHILCLDVAPTGDAIIAALKLLDSLQVSNFDIESSLRGFNKFPQTLINLNVGDPNSIIINSNFWSEVTEIERKLSDKGRVLIRPSGTEPLIRIMVESESQHVADDYVNHLAKVASEI